jgi:hypothetical protein
VTFCGISTHARDAVPIDYFACQDRINFGIHPLLIAFGNDSGVSEASGLEGQKEAQDASLIGNISSKFTAVSWLSGIIRKQITPTSH